MANLPRGIKHVDRRALYTDLGARVSYLKEFIEFGSGIFLRPIGHRNHSRRSQLGR